MISHTRSQWPLLLILLIAIAPYFISLGSSSLWDANEAFYAETPREMIEAGDLINPTFNYHPRLNKPPLSYWIVIPFYKIFGVSETSERVPIALGGLTMIAIALFLGRLLYSTKAGWLAAICLAIAPRFLMFSRRIMIDVYVSVFMSLVLLFFVLAQKQPERRRLYLVLMYICAGLGVLTKGPVAVLLPSIAFAIYLALHKELNQIKTLMLPVGIVIVIVIVLPWYAAIYGQHGWNHIQSFILKDNLSRYTEAVWGPRRGPLFYAPVMMGDLFPWSLFLLPLLVLALRWLWLRARAHAKTDPVDEGHATSLLIAWIGTIVIFYSLSRSKEDLYILPIYSALSALIGNVLTRCDRMRVLGWSVFGMGIVFVLAGFGILYLFGASTQAYYVAGSRIVGWTFIAGGLIAAGLSWVRRVHLGLIATAFTMAVSNWAFVTQSLPDFERYKPVRSLCEVIQSEASPDALIGYYQTAFPSMVFYLRRPVFEYYQPAEIEAALNSDREAFCLLSAADFEAERERIPKARVLASRPIFQVKLRGILNRTEPPQILLISNKGGSSIEK